MHTRTQRLMFLFALLRLLFGLWDTIPCLVCCFSVLTFSPGVWNKTTGPGLSGMALIMFETPGPLLLKGKLKISYLMCVQGNLWAPSTQRVRNRQWQSKRIQAPTLNPKEPSNTGSGFARMALSSSSVGTLPTG